MSLTNVKNRLQDDFAAITGVTRAYDDLPNVATQSPDLPAVIMARRDPFITARGDTLGTIEYEYHFDILFLYKAIGTETVEAWDSGIEVFPQRFVEKLCADITGAATWLTWNKDDESHFTFGIIEYRSGKYFGFRWDLDISERIETTMSAGV